jgi:autoinducer 2-degrading protein
MIVTLVHIWVKDENLEEFKQATVVNHEQTIKEPGNLRFDFLQDDADPSKFILYEVFESGEAVAAHKNTPHYLEWRDAVAPWMAKPREGIKHKVIKPMEKELW